ncbi:MAG: hypothetical protein ABJO86_13170 [Lentilitoribacter sp.]
MANSWDIYDLGSIFVWSGIVRKGSSFVKRVKMQDNFPSKVVAPIKQTEWSGLIDSNRINQTKVILLLKQLASDAFKYKFDHGPALKANSYELDALRPLLAGKSWLYNGAKQCLSYLRPLLNFKSGLEEFKTNEVALVVGATLKNSGIFRKLINRWTVRNSAVLGSDDLFKVFQHVAWSDASLNEAVMAVVNTSWRSKILFYPDEPNWPKVISHPVFVVVVYFALEASKPEGSKKTAGILEKALKAELEKALEDLCYSSQVEQLLAYEAYKGCEEDFDDFFERFSIAKAIGLGDVESAEDAMNSGNGEEQKIEKFIQRYFKNTL